ncbi:hypothetical protein LSH36_885g00066 [Paralvinella palmiformis]|uniref:Uncharacterized protein n=1 Tax=Paralvinella palmiformis TaxID=53620 RepID=A0AAD9IY13_9ANNE|nr:hypothetical protein LSH36_885g00066 [Paralvinella palmiformis]
MGCFSPCDTSLYQDVSELQPSGELSIKEALTTVELSAASDVGVAGVQYSAPLREQPKHRLDFQSHSVYDNLSDCAKDEDVDLTSEGADNRILPLTIDVEKFNPWELRQDDFGHSSNYLENFHNTSLTHSDSPVSQQNSTIHYLSQQNNPYLGSTFGSPQSSPHLGTNCLNQPRSPHLGSSPVSHSSPYLGRGQSSQPNSPHLGTSSLCQRQSPNLKESHRSHQNSPHLGAVYSNNQNDCRSRYSPLGDQSCHHPRYSHHYGDRNVLDGAHSPQMATRSSLDIQRDVNRRSGECHKTVTYMGNKEINVVYTYGTLV